MTLDSNLISTILSQAASNPRRRQNLDLRTSPDDGSQRMLNALLPGTMVPIHRHPRSSETVICISGRMDEVFFAEDGLTEVERIHLCPAEGRHGCSVPAGTWHTVEILEPSVIFESKDGKYGEDGSETC